VKAQIDHLVVVADSLDQGVAWCEATLGITPGPGGDHALFGTHNRLFKIATPEHPRAYFEIIAINPKATPTRAGKRWFDMDDEALREAVKHEPRLLHFVASTGDAQAVCHTLQQHDMDRGDILQASRMTPQGLLEWQITVRPDGQRLFNGCLPTFIQWGAAHPADHMPDSGVELQSVEISHPEFADLFEALRETGPDVTVSTGSPNLMTTLRTPKGLITLSSQGV
jgi:hypothetical protein